MLRGTAAPAASAGGQRTSIAAALWQTTPEDGSWGRYSEGFDGVLLGLIWVSWRFGGSLDYNCNLVWPWLSRWSPNLLKCGVGGPVATVLYALKIG